jgi:hypothetical protein
VSRVSKVSERIEEVEEDEEEEVVDEEERERLKFNPTQPNPNPIFRSEVPEKGTFQAYTRFGSYSILIYS